VRPNEKLLPAQLSPMEAVRYKARDGLEIPAYLTLPTGREPKSLPLVIMPHGGPYGVRDTLEFDPEVQFLANRGYVVLQPNYRGSDSYGIDYYKRGYGEWGRRMQDDLDDGMDWLVGRGIVDPKRACLVGSSYGGYAAAWGATRNPERYRCASCFAGVFNLRKQLFYTSDFLSSRLYKEFKSTVRGPETRASIIECPPDGQWAAIRFRLGVHMPSLPTGLLLDHHDVHQPVSADGTFELHGLRWPLPDLENAERYVDQLARCGVIAREQVVEAADAKKNAASDVAHGVGR